MYPGEMDSLLVFAVGSALLTRCRRKSESPAQRVKNTATTIMMTVTAKGPFFIVDRAASQPLQKEKPEVR